MDFNKLYDYLMEHFTNLHVPSDPYKGMGGRITTVLKKPSGFKGDYGGEEISGIPANLFPQYSNRKKKSKPNTKRG
jgi:hypothetical protein